MLSRSAEAVYWMSRYVERAENVTRLLGVNFNAMLEAQIDEHQLGWALLAGAFGNQERFRNAYGDEVSARRVTEFMLWHPDNPSAVLACIQRARENARGVREQISSEMWEQINRMYHRSREVDQAAVLDAPHEFFRFVRDASQAFHGITDGTMTTGEAFEFIQLGKYLERGSYTVGILDMKYVSLRPLQDGSPEAIVQLIATLRSCSALEPFRRTHALELLTWRVMEYLLLSREFPRAVAFCMDRAAQAVSTVAGTGVVPTLPSVRLQSNPFAAPQRLFGKICADLEFLEIRDVLGDAFHAFVLGLLERINAASDELTRTFFNTQIILPEADPQAQQQQQQ